MISHAQTGYVPCGVCTMRLITYVTSLQCNLLLRCGVNEKLPPSKKTRIQRKGVYCLSSVDVLVIIFHGIVQTGVRDVMNIPLPRPLSVAEVENAGDYALDNGTRSDNEQSQPEVRTFDVI